MSAEERQWFGDVPTTWTIGKMRSVVYERREKFNRNEELIILSLLKDVGVIPYSEKGDIGNKSKDDHTQYKVARKGDLVINSMNVIIGSVGISPYDGYISPAYYSFVPRVNTCMGFIGYLCSTRKFQKAVRCYAKGIMEIRLRVSSYDFLSMPIPLPPLPEQKKIVAYLDAETGRIDKAIAAEEKMIALLQERREIVINEAVGGGDFSRQEHKERKGWKWSTIRRHFTITLGKMLCSSKLSDDYKLEKYFCAADVHFGDLATTDNKQMWFSRKEKEQYLVKNGDLLIVEGGAGAGGACVVEGLKENFYIQNSILRLRSRGTASERFVCYVLEGLVKRGYIDMACNKATIPHFTKEKVGEVPIPLPPLPEQEEIVKRLDAETGKIDRAIEVKRRQIELLRERRQIVIDEAVTGKVKVA